MVGSSSVPAASLVARDIASYVPLSKAKSYLLYYVYNKLHKLDININIECVHSPRFAVCSKM